MQNQEQPVVETPPPAEKPSETLIYGQAASKIANLSSGSHFIQGRDAAEVYVSLLDGEWKPRWSVEDDPTFRQVIPYVIIQQRDTGKIVVMDRTAKQTEARLHSNVYIGVGGHIELEDAQKDRNTSASACQNVILQACWREIREETGFTTGQIYNAGILCVNGLNEPMVQRVHVGVVYHLFTKETEFSGEIDTHNARWEDPAALAAQFGRLEPWSQLVANYYLKCFNQHA